jgi:feruloyl esterase
MPRISLAKQSSLLIALAACALPVDAAANCESLASLALKGAAVTAAEAVAAGGFTQAGGRGGGKGGNAYANLPAFCRVAAMLKPTSDSEIKIEVWLPAANWNSGLESVGNGAWAGTIGYPAMATAVAAGYAAASTDTGHAGNNVMFVVGHPEKLVDFAYRAVHEMTVAAKAITAGYYGQAAKHSYFNGCSTGGRQAIAEAQRFPGDYDGIIAGDPDFYATHIQAAQLFIGQAAHKDEAAQKGAGTTEAGGPVPASYIPPANYAALHKAALEACDALDGVKDGVIEDPTRCKFDPGAIACTGASAPTCLTPEQVETARNTYAGTHAGKSTLWGLEPGSESGWASLSGPQPLGLAVDTYQYLVFNDPKWDYHTLDPAKDVAAADKAVGAIMNSADPNLKPFFSHGGKLIMYHGWADPGIPPMFSVDYFKSVVEKDGGAQKKGAKTAAESIRLFMVPGMGHCAGGDGPSTFNSMAALAEWVEQGKAPDQIVASHATRGQVDRTRPLCPYPQTAVYKGSGSTDDAANFVCKAP